LFSVRPIHHMVSAYAARSSAASSSVAIAAKDAAAVGQSCVA
jgi:hypothetical protein